MFHDLALNTQIVDLTIAAIVPLAIIGLIVALDRRSVRSDAKASANAQRALQEASKPSPALPSSWPA